MEIFKTFEKSDVGTAVALGYFDGVHLAHMKVINKTVSLGQAMNLVPSVLTFHMDREVPNKIGVKNITSDKNKISILERYNIKRVYIPNFGDISNMDATDFFEQIIIEKVNAKVLVCGYNYTFGKNGEGDTDLLMSLCEKYNIEFHMINPLQKSGKIVSSTKIRKYISEGRMKETNDMLGYVFFIRANVFRGNQMGRTIGYPTINQMFEEGQLIPRYGVYHSTIYVDDKIFKGVTNVGVKPTIEGENPVCAETHIVGIDTIDLYDKMIIVAFNEYIRPEKKFSNIMELQEAIKDDIDKLFLR